MKSNNVKREKQLPFGEQLRGYLKARGTKYSWLVRQCPSIDKYRLNRIFAGCELEFGEAVEIAAALKVPLESLKDLSKLDKIAA